MDSQVMELLGRTHLVGELLRAGLEVALPMRDRGVDLIAYADLDGRAGPFAARPSQMKAASAASFSVDAKYARFPHLLLTHVWHLSDPRATVVYALDYAEGLEVARLMGWTKTDLWARGTYVNTRPGARLTSLLEPYRMTADRRYAKVAGVPRSTIGGSPPAAAAGGGTSRALSDEEVGSR